jgi:undecaprenyl-diphosphatase
LEELISLDKELFLFLNGLGSESYDEFWKIVTKQLNWTPFILAVFYLIQRKIGWKNFGIIILFIAVLIAFTDQITNLFKYSFERLRPCNDTDVNGIARIIIHRDSFSFFSGHASNSMATTTFIFLLLRKHYKFTFLIFLFPLIFAFSRIYLGLHFPSDILVGYLFGATFGFAFYKLYDFLARKYQWQTETVN